MSSRKAVRTRTPPPARHRQRIESASRGPLWTALGVALAAVGCAPAGPRAPAAAAEPLRHHMDAQRPTQAVLSYLRAGPTAGARLILVHGTPGAASGWIDYLLDPPPGMEVLALDRPGFGHSGPPGGMPGLADQAAAVLALMPADGRPVVLLGHSLGASVVARVAADHPQRVAALVLVAGSLDPALESIHPLQRLGAWAPLRSLLPRSIRNANRELMALKPQLEALGALLPRIQARVIIVHGTRDDLVPVANVRYLQARLTGARCVHTVLLEGRNHFLPWNSEEAVRDAVRWAQGDTC